MSDAHVDREALRTKWSLGVESEMVWEQIDGDKINKHWIHNVGIMTIVNNAVLYHMKSDSDRYFLNVLYHMDEK